ncbi:MAG: TIM-barrel domain-containing protein [Kiritimatiellia bacterium]
MNGRALILSLLMLRTATAEEPMRNLLNHTFENGILRLAFADGELALTLYSANALEAVFTPRGGATSAPSRAIGSAPVPVAAQLMESEERLLLQTDGLEIDVRKLPLQIAYRFKGQPLIEEDCGAENGFHFRLAEGEKLFGGGSRALGKMDRRGEKLELYNSACYAYEETARLMYYSMPAVVSSKKYMLAFDNVARGHLDLDSAGDGVLRFAAVGGRMAYLLIAGESWPDLAGQIAQTTGRQPLLPRWALGNVASRMGYHSQAEVEAVVDGFRRDGIPLDAIVLDLFWFGPSIFGSMGNLDWDRAAFPEPVAMMEKIRAQGVQTILITEPIVLKESINWANAVSNRVLATDADGHPQTFAAFFGEAALIDVFQPAARDWFWAFYKKHTASGVAGWWGDLGEPETHPDDIRHAEGLGEDLHNAFGHEWARLVHEGFQRDFPEMRPFNLMRSGFVGTQRYGILPWSGDVNRTWAGFQPQVELALQMGLQGVAWMHSDLGGFAGTYRDPELYVRWLQYGVFQPIYRPHAHEEVPPEPIFWDEATKAIVRRAIQLRYQLLPYNYTLMYENATAGLPLMRPLMYLDDRPEMEDCLDAFLWGDAFLVAPVTEKGATTRAVPLPRNSAWFDFWTGARHEGGQTIAVPLTMETTPVFVKAGAFVPMIAPIQSTAHYDPAQLDVHYYADASVSASAGQFYDDDGKSPRALDERRYELLRFRSERGAQGGLVLRLDGDRHDYPGRPDARIIRFIVHNLAKPPAQVAVDGRKIPVDWRDGLLTVAVDWSGAPRAVAVD